MRNHAKKFFDLINLLAEWICHILLTTLVCIIVVQVFLRYVMRSPLSWTEEVALLLLVWFGMLAVAIAVYRHTHMAITVIWSRLSTPVRHVVNISVEVLIILFALNISINAEILVNVVNGQYLPASEFPKAWLYHPLQFGGVLMAFNAFGNVLLNHYPGKDDGISNFEV